MLELSKMTYKETIDFLYTQLPMYQKSGKSAFKKDLTNIKALCNSLGNPQDKFPTIHIAGTNGKGTTSHILSALFQTEKLTVGLYTSPHYKDFRERIKINGQYISRKAVIEFVELILPTLKTIKASFFEITVALAFYHFNQKKVDIAIIETGLGGRLDSTNIISPELSVITNISLDHTDMLGNTLTSIAKEKAGIIKKRIPVLIGEKQATVKEVFLKKAKKKNSKLSYAQSVCQIKLIKENLTISQYDIKLQEISLRLKSTITGPFQIKNIRTALSAYAIYKNSKNQKIEKSVIKKSLVDIHDLTNYMGRWQVKRRSPLTILDSAHNEAGIDYVVRRLLTFKNKNLHIVIGFVKDKNWKSLLAKFPQGAQYYFCTAQIRRALDGVELKTFAELIGLSGRSYTTVSGAERAALTKANSGDVIFIGGSTFVVSEAL